MGTKTRLQMRTDLALDLKITIDTELSATELNRSIERSVADFNRYLPDEKIYEDSLQFAVTGESVTFPKEADADAILAAVDLSGTSAGDTYNPTAGQPDVPRPLRCTITDDDNGMVGLTLIVNGIDKDDQAIQEIFHYSKGDDKIVFGKKYFKAVHTLEVDQIYYAESGDKLDVGFGPYTDVWVYLANSPIKWRSESATDAASEAITRNTDFYIDYANGRVKAISGGDIAQEETCTFAYSKSQIGIDLSDLPGLIRVQRVEYPVGKIPQNFVQQDTFGKYVIITGGGEAEEQQPLAEDQQYRIYYDAVHQAPGEYSPGTIPDFLENTVEMMAGAYALYILALKQEHQAATNLTTARTALGNATGTHSALAIALANLKKYLDNNNTTDAAGLLDDINNDTEALKGLIETAIAAANTFLDEVATDLGNANDTRPKYMGATANYVDGETAPDIKKYLDDGDALLNEVAKGGEGQDVPRAYAEYARAVRDTLVAAFEQDRRFYQQNATARTNAAMGFANEAAQHLSFLRSFIERAAGYTAIANTFATNAGHLLSQIMSYLQQASQYVSTASSDISLADRFRAEADGRRNEVYSIWRDRKQYIGDFTVSSMRQMPSYD